MTSLIELVGLSDSSEQRVEWRLPGRGGGGRVCLIGKEFQFKTRKFWSWMAETVAEQCEGSQCYRTVTQERLGAGQMIQWVGVLAV